MTFSTRLFSPPLKNNYLLFSFLQFDYNYCILWIGYCNWENFEKSELSHLQFVDSNFLLLSAIYRIIFHSEIRESNFKIAQKNAKIILNAGKARTRFDHYLFILLISFSFQLIILLPWFFKIIFFFVCKLVFIVSLKNIFQFSRSSCLCIERSWPSVPLLTQIACSF